MPAGNSSKCALLLLLCLFSGLAYSHLPVDDQIAHIPATPAPKGPLGVDSLGSPRPNLLPCP